MSDIVRRVIQVGPDQVIGPPRRRRQRKPKGDPMDGANWCATPVWLMPSWETPPSAPTQQGFGHFDKIAQRMKA